MGRETKAPTAERVAAFAREWSTKERLYLTSCVVKFGEHNWSALPPPWPQRRERGWPCRGAVSKMMARVAAEDPEVCKAPESFATAVCAAQFDALVGRLTSAASGGGPTGGGRRQAASPRQDAARSPRSRGSTTGAVSLSSEAITKQLLSQLTLDRMGQLESLILDGEEEMEVPIPPPLPHIMIAQECGHCRSSRPIS